MNKVFLIGNLTRDPEMRSTQSGVSVCNFSIAVNRRFRNAQTGQQETDFLNIVAWRQLAELCGRYLTKGSKVAVTGSIQTRTYEAQDGSKRSAFDIVADEVEFLPSANRANGAPSGDYHQAPAAPAAAHAEAAAAIRSADSDCRDYRSGADLSLQGAVSKWLKQAMRGSAFFRNIFGQAKTECRKNGTQGIIFIRNCKWNEL